MWSGVVGVVQLIECDRVSSRLNAPTSNCRTASCSLHSQAKRNSKKQLGTIPVSHAFDQVTSGARLDSSCERVQLIRLSIARHEIIVEPIE